MIPLAMSGGDTGWPEDLEPVSSRGRDHRFERGRFDGCRRKCARLCGLREFEQEVLESSGLDHQQEVRFVRADGEGVR